MPQPWLRPIAPELARLVPAERDVVLALGVDPAAVLRAVKALGMAREVAHLEAHAALVTGDVLLVASWGQTIPAGAVCALLRDSAAADRFLTDTLAGLRAKPVELAGAQRAWRLATPIGAVTVARNGARLVAGNDTGEVDRLLGGVAAEGGSSMATALRLRLDLAKPGAVLLPLLYAAARGSEKTIGPDPFSRFNGTAGCWGFLLRERPQPGSLWQTVIGDRSSHHELGPFRQIFGRDGLQAGVDRSLTLLRAPGEETFGSLGHQLIVRTSAGYLCSGRLNPAVASRLGVTETRGGNSSSWRWQAERQARTFSPEEFATAFAGWTRLAGPEVANLPVIEIPEPVVVDQRWLPPLGALLRHLPVTEITIEVHGDRLELSERGAPVLAAGLLASVLTAGAVTDRMQQDERRAEAQRHERAVWAKHPRERQALEAIAAALERDGFVERLSALVHKGILRLEDCAALFNGRIPTADELDDLCPLGEWQGQHQTGDWRLIYALDATTWAGIDYVGKVIMLGSDDRAEVGRPREVEPATPVAPGPTPGDF